MIIAGAGRDAAVKGRRPIPKNDRHSLASDASMRRLGLLKGVPGR